MRKGWEYKKLGEVCALTMGQSPDGNSINEVNGIEFHQGKTCFGERFLGISPLYSNAPTKLAEAHSVLLCVRAPVGYPNITDRKICIGRGLCALYAKREIDNSFLYYSLLGKQSYFEKNATGSTFKAISSKIVSNTTLSIPPLSTQLAIVSELDKINELIRLKKEQLKDFDNLAQSLFYEMFGDSVENEKGWEVKKLGDCFSYIKNGANIKQTKDVDGFPITRIETLAGGIFNRDRMGYAGIYDLSKYSAYVLESRDLLMSHINSKTYIGRTVEYKRNNDETIIHGMNLLRLKAIHDIIDSTFFVYYTKSGDFKSKIARIRKDAVNQSSFAISDLKRLNIPLPPLSLQRLFAQRIEQIEREKSEVQKSIQDLETLLASRMQYWFE